MMKFIENIKYFVRLSPLYDWLGKRSYAQSGEDLIAWVEMDPRLREDDNNKGFYVDVGAYHPKLFSNTYLFYKKGWRGICIDPNPEMGELFARARPRDVFLNLGVGGVTGDQRGVSSQDYLTRRLLRGKDKKVKRGSVMKYYMFEDGAANTFSAEQAKKNQEKAGRKLMGKRMILVLPLKTIFEKYLPKGQKIDLLSVDVEGMDEEVLRSNDWKKYRPEMIIAEDLDFDLGRLMDGVQQGVTSQDYLSRRLLKGRDGVVGFLNNVGYKLVAKTPYSLIFRVVK